jgi:hypothetical protein
LDASTVGAGHTNEILVINGVSYNRNSPVAYVDVFGVSTTTTFANDYNSGNFLSSIYLNVSKNFYFYIDIVDPTLPVLTLVESGSWVAAPTKYPIFYTVWNGGTNTFTSSLDLRTLNSTGRIPVCFDDSSRIAFIGSLVYNKTTDILYFYDGAGWRAITMP